MGVPSLNDLAVDGTLNTTNQPTYIYAPLGDLLIGHGDPHLIQNLDLPLKRVISEAFCGHEHAYYITTESES